MPFLSVKPPRCFFRRTRRSIFTPSSNVFRNGLDLSSEVDAEPLPRYRTGGYHPVHLNDHMKSGRYQIIHKLGWGGYSTVWLANDKVQDRHVALKISTAEVHENDNEARSLGLTLDSSASAPPGSTWFSSLLDKFNHTGPNGTHRCLVLELLGPSVQAAIDTSPDHRLAAEVARTVSKQATEALAHIHDKGLAHGDFHTGNIVFADPEISRKSTEEVMRLLGKPETGDVETGPGFSAHKHVPRYLVWPSALPMSRDPKRHKIKVVDFGSSFLPGEKPSIRCPLVFRAPEAVLTNSADLRADIWSLGCVIFELVVGSPPFDNLMPDKVGLIREWIATFGSIPSEWNEYMPPESLEPSSGIEPMSLTEWLLESYYDEGRPADLSEDDVRTVGDLLETTMRYRPEDRPSARQLLEHAWFKRQTQDQ